MATMLRPPCALFNPSRVETGSAPRSSDQLIEGTYVADGERL